MSGAASIIGETIGAAFAGMPSRMIGVMDQMSAVSKFQSEQEKWERKYAYMSFVTNRSTKFHGPKRKSNRLNISRLTKLKHRKAR